MNRFTKKILMGILLLAILTPLGLFLPFKFKAGDAWGEWSVEKIKKELGFAPRGMEKNAELWKAPLPEYSNGNVNNSLFVNSEYYILSGFVGIGLIALATFVLLKIYRKHD
jgi:hypothetical protein